MTNLAKVAHDTRKSLILRVRLRGRDARSWRLGSDMVDIIVIVRYRSGLLVNSLHDDKAKIAKEI